MLRQNIKFKIISWSRDDSGKVVKRPLRDICNALTSKCGSGIVNDDSGMGNTTPYVLCRQYDKDMQNDDLLTHCIVARMNRKTGDIEHFGIRKLTPRECFRLMGVAEQDIDNLFSTDENGKRLISNSAMYKLAGNSIVCRGCLSAIYENIFINKYLEHSDEKGQYLLF